MRRAGDESRERISRTETRCGDLLGFWRGLLSDIPILSRQGAMDLQLLKKTAIADLDDGELAALRYKEQTFKSGQHIFKEGEPGNPSIDRFGRRPHQPRHSG
jgi:hypothetical protein